jgi:hypothetical protein
MVFAATVLAASLITDINVIDVRLGLLDRIEPQELDEIGAAVLLLLISVIADLPTAGRRQPHEIQLVKMAKVVDLTTAMAMGAVRDCLGQLQVVRIEAEGHVPPQTLALFDRANRALIEESSGLVAMRETTARLLAREMGSRHP